MGAGWNRIQTLNYPLYVCRRAWFLQDPGIPLRDAFHRLGKFRCDVEDRCFYASPLQRMRIISSVIQVVSGLGEKAWVHGVRIQASSDSLILLTFLGLMIPTGSKAGQFSAQRSCRRDVETSRSPDGLRRFGADSQSQSEESIHCSVRRSSTASENSLQSVG